MNPTIPGEAAVSSPSEHREKPRGAGASSAVASSGMAPLASLLALAGALAWLYAPSVSWLLAQWEINPYYAHGRLLPFVVAWLLWRERDQLRSDWRAHLSRNSQQSGSKQPDGGAARRAKWTAPLCLIFGLLMYLVGALADVNMAQALSIPFVLLGVARLVGGPDVARRVRFPFLFLLLAVPSTGLVIEWLSVPMQINSARGAALWLGLLGVPVHREGVNILAANYNFVVEEGCSGLKTAVTLLTMGVLTSHLAPGLSRAQRFGLALCSIPIALIANTLRVMAIVLVGYNMGTKAAEGFLHNFSGVLMFSLALALLGGMARGLSTYNHAHTVETPGKKAPGKQKTESGLANRIAASRAWPMKTMAAATALLLLTRGLSVYGVQAPPPSRVAGALSLPSQAGAWRGENVPVEPTLYTTLRAEAIARKRYFLSGAPAGKAREARAVDVIVVYSRDFKSLHSPLSCLLAGGWSVKQEETRTLTQGARTVSLHLLRGEMNGQETLQTYFFADTSRELGGLLATAAHLAGNRLLRRDDGAVKVQLAYDPALWQPDGKLKPQLESLVFSLDEAVRQALARGHREAAKAAS